MRLIKLFLLVFFITGAGFHIVEAGEFALPYQETVVFSNEYAKRTQKNFIFENGEFFWMARYEFLETSDKPYVSTFAIPGDEIQLRYTTTIDGEKQWIKTDDITKTISATLFIETDKYHMILGVPAVYEKQDEYGTMKIASDFETPVKITKNEGGYVCQITFPQNEEYIGEFWGLQSEDRLIVWDERAESQFMSHELAVGRRLSMEGYYFQTLSGYTPGGEDVLFRHPSSYTGGSFSRYSATIAETALGYAIMSLSAVNQNELGFYPTPCQSDWLWGDFGISQNYYDTRWNSDFAVNLLDAYIVYGDVSFLERAEKYAEFFMNFAEKNSYDTETGILVQDYWHEEGNEPTHISLNHHLSELNFLLRLYGITKDERYSALAMRMLSGIEDTEEQWSLPDGNLVYALYYNGTMNKMIDYPYLTYNDLFATRNLLRSQLGNSSGTIQRLMDKKLGWMLENGVTGYFS